MTFGFSSHYSEHRDAAKTVVTTEFCEVNAIYPSSIRINDGKWFKSLVHNPVFGGAISHIVELSSKKQMIWSYARAVVAVMADIKTFIKLPVGKFICNAMGHKSALSSMTSITENAIAVSISDTLPFPATISLLGFFPKSFFNWSFSRGHIPSLSYGNVTGGKV